MADIGNIIEFNPTQNRIYTYPNKTVKIKSIAELVIRPSGDHRLKTKNGHLHIMPTGWVHIEIITPKKDWTV